MNFHLRELEVAQKDTNPAKFKLAFNDFKIFVVQNWKKIDYDLDSKFRKQIEEVFVLENSNEFRINKFISCHLDPLSRFLYLATFLLYFCVKLSDLFDLQWLRITAPVLFGISIVIYILIHLKLVMIRKECDF